MLGDRKKPIFFNNKPKTYFTNKSYSKLSDNRQWPYNSKQKKKKLLEPTYKFFFGIIYISFLFDFNDGFIRFRKEPDAFKN